MKIEWIAKSRQLSIASHIRKGWTWFEDRGWLGRGAVMKRPSEVSSIPQPWEPRYNPLEHSVAVLMGGEPVHYGREVIPRLFRLKSNGIYVDENGQITARGNIEGVCIGCGTRRGPEGQIIGLDARWKVRTASANPMAEPWKQAWTYCRVCVTQGERDAHRTWQRGQQAATEQQPQRR